MKMKKQKLHYKKRQKLQINQSNTLQAQIQIISKYLYLQSSNDDLPKIQIPQINQNIFEDHHLQDQSHSKSTMAFDFCTQIYRENEQQHSNHQGINRNIPKQAIKKLKYHLASYHLIYKHDPQLLMKITGIIDNFIQLQKADRNKNCLTMAHLSQICASKGSSEIENSSRLARLVMHKMISRYTRNDVRRSNLCSNKKIYLNALKVYGLRCRNIVTAARMQTASNQLND